MTKTFALLIKDHKMVKGILDELLETTSAAKNKRRDLLLRLKDELELHENIEENVVYPVLKKHEQTKHLALESYEEHHIVDVLLAELASLDYKDESWQAKLKVLQENLLHHITEEEKELFPEAEKILPQKKLDKITLEIEQMKADSVNN